MARGNLTIVKRLVYDNLGLTDIDGSGYGTLLTNKRYPTAYIDDKIAEADLYISDFLMKNKQNELMSESFTSTPTTFPFDIDNKWFLIAVEYYTTVGGVKRRAEEVPFEVYRSYSENLGAIYDALLVKGHYAKQDANIYLIPDQTFSSNTGVVTYLNLSHPSTLSALQTPAGFEDCVANLASANLLMKRNDNPEQSKYLMNEVKEFLQLYAMQDTNVPDRVDD